MEVYGSDNQRLGTIDRLDGSELAVSGQRFTQSAVARVEGDRVYLSGSPAQYQSASATRADDEVRIPVHQERLNVEKQTGQIGDVQVHKTVTEEQQSIPVNVSREEIQVEKRKIPERPVRDDEAGGAFQEGTIRVPVRGEEVVLSKETVVTGEVIVHKERKTERQLVTDTVRKEHIEVNQNVEPSRSVSAPA